VPIGYHRINNESILVTEGFLYQRDVTLKEKYVIFIVDVERGNLFVAAEGSTIPVEKKILAEMPPLIIGLKVGKGSLFRFHPTFTGVSKTGDRFLEDAINVTWTFVKPGISFTVGNCTLASVHGNATAIFTKEGVLLNGLRPDCR
jgi:hypothetical protein